MNFKDKVVLVTGASRGIGKQTIIEFAKKGCNVIINYLNSKKEAIELKEFVEKEYKVNALVIKTDISNEKEVINMVNLSIDKFKKIDILVNNAAISVDNDFYEKTVDEFNKVLNTNLVGTYLVSKHVSKYMLEKKYGKIINVSSTNGIDTSYPMSVDYDASKAGVISLTRNFAIQLSPYVNVNTVAPGWVNTDINKDLYEEFKKDEINKIFLKRFAEPEEIAKVIVFLASNDASYVNNSVIRVDGGY